MKGVLGFLDGATVAVPTVLFWGCNSAAGTAEIVGALSGQHSSTAATGATSSATCVRLLLDPPRPGAAADPGQVSSHRDRERVEAGRVQELLAVEGSWPIRELKATFQSWKPSLMVIVVSVTDGSSLEAAKGVMEVCQGSRLRYLVVANHVRRVVDAEVHPAEVASFLGTPILSANRSGVSPTDTAGAIGKCFACDCSTGSRRPEESIELRAVITAALRTAAA